MGSTETTTSAGRRRAATARGPGTRAPGGRRRRQGAAASDCDGLMVRHGDGWRECLDADCGGDDLPHGPLDVPCHAVFDGDCPRCGPPS